MKKLLLGTTALVGASMAATAAFAAPEVRLGGFVDFQTGFSSQDTDGFGPAPGVPATGTSDRGFGFVTDTELLIRASDKLDNGLAWAVKIEMEADSQDRASPATTASTESNADEVSIVFSGTWGQLTLGNEDGPSDSLNMTGAAMISGIGTSGSKGFRRWTNTQSFANSMWSATVDVTDSNDATKVMYYTPNIAGFQAGVSYSADDGDSGRLRAPDVSGTGGQAFENWIEAGVSYEFKVDDIGFGIAAAGNHADSKSPTQDDVRSYSLTGKASFGGFKVSLGYGKENVPGAAGAAKGTDVSGYGGGVMYTTGPYQIGVSYMHNDQDNPIGVSGGNDYSNDTFTLGAAYALGAGVQTYVDTWYFTKDAGGTAGLLENDAIGLLVGTQITF